MKSLTDLLRFEINETNLAVRSEQLRSRLNLYVLMVIPQVMLAVLLTWLMWGHIALDVLTTWLSMVFLVHGFELYFWWSYRTNLEGVAECRQWSKRFKWFTLLVAIVWGSAGVVMFVPGDLAFQVLLLCVVMGLASAAVTSNVSFPPSMFIYVSGVILPILLRLAWEGDQHHLILAGMLGLFFVFVLNAAVELIRTFELSLQRRFENEHLVAELVEQKAGAEASRLVAEQANQAKSKFLATASHDLRQPLQALRLFSEALLDTAKEPETVRLAGQIGKSVNALVDMFDDLLDVSRMDAGIVRISRQHFSLAHLFDRLYADFAPLAYAKRLDLILPVDGMGGEGSGTTVFSDPVLLERMLRNLISNAIRYTDNGSVEVKIRHLDGNIWLEVVDTGIGIDPEVMPHIFEEYYQAGNPHRDRRKGLGLGLAIVRRIEGILGCRVTVKSEPGTGSSFVFAVPVGDATMLAQPYSVAYSHDDLQGVVVALVEDDPDIRESVANLMEQWGCRVFAGEMGDDVIRELDIARMRPDLLVCDYRLPRGMTGTQIIRRMRELWGNNVPALVLTGDTAAETLHEIHASGAMLLHKPIAPVRLRSIMYFALHGEN
ncbi:MAG: hybrid sensor histidine kinase/response regulator [Sideroxyarcus sp.]|nr:hybrid sensor histidine kinase/response regulator [Sideroxyarcus sp.]